MRTVTFIGLSIIGGALRNLAEMPERGYETFFAIILICCIVMDVSEFIKIYQSVTEHLCKFRPEDEIRII